MNELVFVEEWKAVFSEGIWSNTDPSGQIARCYSIAKNKSNYGNFQGFRYDDIIKKIHCVDIQLLKYKNKLKIPTIKGDFRRCRELNRKGTMIAKLCLPFTFDFRFSIFHFP